MNLRLMGLLCVTLAGLFEACGQLAFKLGAHNAPTLGGAVHVLHRLWRKRVVAVGMLCFGVEAILWTMALRLLDVSLAFPVSSLCFVFILVLSRLWLREQVSAERWIGVSLILSGVVLIGLS